MADTCTCINEGKIGAMEARLCSIEDRLHEALQATSEMSKLTAEAKVLLSTLKESTKEQQRLSEATDVRMEKDCKERYAKLQKNIDTVGESLEEVTAKQGKVSTQMAALYCTSGIFLGFMGYLYRLFVEAIKS